MEVIEAIRNRRSIRGFKSQPVSRNLLEEILNISLWAPSSRNQQSWEFAVLGGSVMEKVKASLQEKIQLGEKATTDLPAAELTGVYLKRALELRDSIDKHQFPEGTPRIDEKRAQYWIKGGIFWDAPNAIILYTDRKLGPKAIFDGGIMAQTIALTAFSYGLGTCILIRAVDWPDVLRKHMGIAESKLIIVAIAIGYPDYNVLPNSYERHRDTLEHFAKWHGFE